MTSSIRLGRIAGVEVGINWSLLVIFALVAGGLAFGRLPAAYPDEPTGAYVAVGLFGAVAFFASILAHELGHAIVARRHGVDVEGITLWLFGGVARLSGESNTPTAELRIAGIGPVISIGVGVLAGMLAFALTAAGGAGIVVEALLWLATLNIVLAVFNLLPGAPLDGGRLLRAFLWRRSGDKLGSAVSAAKAGQVLAYLLIGVGVLSFAFGGPGRIWLAFIGWFLLSAARAEEAQAAARDAMGDTRVDQVMTPDPVTVPAQQQIAELLDHDVLRHRVSAFPVVADDGSMVGLLTLHQLREVAPADRATTRVIDIARPRAEVATAAPEERMGDVLARMGTGDGRLLVLTGERVVGIVSPSDVLRLVEHRSLLRDTPSHHVTGDNRAA